LYLDRVRHVGVELDNVGPADQAEAVGPQR
jgi:hypothetical protein